MSDRSAEASIKGYLYQFLHTIKDIMNRADNDDICEIEGIEDFDINKGNEKELIQYKYHEEQKFVNSKVAKPIGIMFNHFLNNKDSIYKYKLFIYLKNRLPTLDKQKLIDILKLKGATDYFDTDKNVYCWETKKHYYSENEKIIDSFSEKFEWENCQKYDLLEKDLIKLLSTNFSVSNDEAKFLYLSNAIKLISDISIKPDNERFITRNDFNNKLKSFDNIVYSSLILRNKNFTTLKSFYKKTKDALNLDKSGSNYIIEYNNIERINSHQLIVELSKYFCYMGRSEDIRPITFIINCDFDDYRAFKKNIFKYISKQSELIKINDGYEDYSFNIDVFNEDRLKTLNPGGNKYEKVSYNFKLVHKDIFLDNMDKINCFSNIGLFVIDSNISFLDDLSQKQFYLNGLTNEQIIEVIGGK